MEIIYDLSLLGFCRDDPSKITGMPRVILEQGTRLPAVPGLDVTFCATEDAEETYPILRRHPAFAGTRFAPWPPGTDGADPFAAARVFHTPHSAVPDAVRNYGRLAVVQTVYDMIPFLLPETLTAEYRDYYADIVARVRPEDHVITISESAKADYCTWTGRDPGRVHVIPLAADTRTFQPCRDEARIDAVRARYKLPPGPYLLSVCTFEPRKNLPHVIRAFIALAREERAADDLTLVLAGGRGWMFEPILAELAGDDALRARIVTTGYVAEADLAPLYSGALGFLYLSCYEGFGLPPLEAMQCGTPVITSNTSSLPEVVGDAGVLLAPDDRHGLCQAMLDLHHLPAHRADLAARALRRAGMFSWERNIRDTADVYRLAAEE